MTDKITIEQIIDGWQTATFGWQDHPDHAIAMRNYDAARNAHDAEFLRRLRAALAAQPAEPCMDTVLRNAARRSATIVDRGRLVKPVEPVAWRDHVEQRIRTWRQRNMNKSGDRLAIDDFMGQESIDDLVDFVCDEYAAPPAPAAVPPGYTMVPIEPTPGMIASGAVALMKASHSDLDCTTDEIAAAYRAMIAAAGEPSHD